MSVEIDTVVRPSALDSGGDLSAVLGTTYVLVDKTAWSLPRQVTADAFFQAAIGANYTRTLNIDGALSTTLQAVEVGGTATPLKVATTKLQLGGASDSVGAFGATPVAKQSVAGGSGAVSANVNAVTVPGTYTSTTQAILQQIVNALAALGWADNGQGGGS